MSIVKIRLLKGLKGILYVLGHKVADRRFAISYSVIEFHFRNMIGPTAHSTEFFHGGVELCGAVLMSTAASLEIASFQFSVFIWSWWHMVRLPR